MSTNGSLRLIARRGLLVCLSLALGAPIAFTQKAFAQESASTPAADEKPEKEENVITGNIASTGNYGYGSQTVNSGATGAAPGDEAGIITAGVSRAGRDECQVTIKNNSAENGYSVSFRVVETDERGSKIGSKYFSASLDPSESETKTLRCRSGSNIAVDLRRANKR